MPNFLEDYKTYYQLRMQRYEGNPDYTNSYQSEKAIYEAVASCMALEEFKDKLGNLNEKNASALIIDEYNIRLRHYNEIKEPIRAEGCKRIIEKAKEIDNVSALITMINEEENKTNLAITADTISPFNDCGYLERMQIWETADVPEKYKSRYRQYAEEEKMNLRNAYAETEKNLNNWQPGWKFDFTRIYEERHRRVLPFSDEVINEQINTTKTIRNAG
ncbi:MAG TPA: hypothetical protein VN451_06205 [Chitinophagaceae bacterium]|nr:hypothetical protein [Chitinophagaceae bacterium]